MFQKSAPFEPITQCIGPHKKVLVHGSAEFCLELIKDIILTYKIMDLHDTFSSSEIAV